MKNFRFKRKDKTAGEEFGLEEQAGSSAPSTPDDLSVSLRAEMLPASEISPDLGRSRFSSISPLKIGALLGFLLLLGLGWLFSVGPGRPVLEKVLSGLVREPQTQMTATPTIPIKTEVAIVPTETVRAENTPTRTPRPLPSATAAVATEAMASETPASEKPTSAPSPTTASGCVDVLSVTVEDVGKTVCVRGEILSFEARPSGFLIAFSNQSGAMYWVSYDLVWAPAKEGLCVEVTGEVMQIANSPVLIFGYQNLPQICTTP